MKKKIITIALILSMLLPMIISTARAQDTDIENEKKCLLCRSDFQEHVISSYAFTFTSYMVYRKKLEMSPEAALFSSIATGLLLSYARDKYLFRKDNEEMGDYMKANAAGAALSAVFTIVIPF